MSYFEIMGDTSHDLPVDYTDKHGIKSASFYIRLDNDDYLKDQVDINREELYAFLRANPNVYPKTSLPSVNDYMEIMKEHLENDKDIICFTLASRLSGSFQSAKVAADMLMEEYPERKIFVIDSRSASTGVGLLMTRAVEMRKKGIKIEEVVKRLKEIALTTEVYICLDTLSYLEMGGRISKTGAFAGNLLRIKPVVSFKDNDLIFEKAVRGTKRSLEYGLKLLYEKIGDEIDKYTIFVVHGDEEERALDVKRTIEEKYKIELEYDVRLVSATIISHIGPGAIAIGCSKVK